MTLAHPWPVGTLFYHTDYPAGTILRVDGHRGDGGYRTSTTFVPEGTDQVYFVGREYSLGLKNRMRYLEPANPYKDEDWV